MRNNYKDETLKILNDHTERIEQITKNVNALFAQPLVHQTPPPSTKSPNTSYKRYQDNTSYLKEIKLKIPKYYGIDDQNTIMWVSKIKATFAMNPPINELEKIPLTTIYLEGDAYDWFTWWSKKSKNYILGHMCEDMSLCYYKIEDGREVEVSNTDNEIIIRYIFDSNIDELFSKL
jgi:hypothetical protein